MADQEDDEGDVSDFDARIAEIAAQSRPPGGGPPLGDYERHVRAETRWHDELLKRRLWEQVKRWMVLGR